ncbi:MAG: SDR family NAD(P)-dependent oxidoreductase [Rhodobacteraceae bacterium]|nr:SDR family NAD(P)-dependent oxidoreductase [Paracoccaceae bacterium]
MAAALLGEKDDVSTLTFAELYSRATSALGVLQQNGLKPGDTVVLSVEDPEAFFILLWACFLGGIVASPVAPGAGSPARVALIRTVWDLCDEPLIICDGGLLQIGEATRPDRVLPADGCLRAGPRAVLPAIRADDPALFPFTSGSTGLPKGILLTNRNILSMVRGTIEMNGFSDSDHCLNWMPPEHPGAAVFLGVLPAYLGVSQVHVKTSRILADPLLWLRLMTRHETAVSWAPNFAFSMVSDAIKAHEPTGIDLSKLRFLVNAGEQVKSRTVLDFLDALMPLGLRDGALRPAFGMAESCSGITWSSGLTRAVLENDPAFISLGRAIPGASLRVTDDTGAPLPEGTVGQLEMLGPSITSGYFRNPAANAAAFTSDGWFRTGDLAYLQDGELHVTGRSKEEIVLNGRNIPFHLIEKCAEGVEGVLANHSCAFPVHDAHGATERLGLVFCKSGQSHDTSSVATEIRRRIAAEFGAQGSVTICVAVEDLPRTSIGKIQRRKLKEAYLAGGLNDFVVEGTNSPAPPARPRSAIESDVLSIWQEILQTDRIGRSENFFDLGGQSILLARMQVRLAERFGSFPLSDLFLHPTVETQAAYLARRENGTRVDPARKSARITPRPKPQNRDIAVIGMACRFPGANTPQAFWANLLGGVDSISRFSASEAILAGVSRSLVEHPDYVKATPRLADAAAFDAGFFGYSDRDAAVMDPQHRLFLEVAWEAFEAAGYDPLALDRSVGVYAGAAMNTYLVNNVLPNLSELDPKAGQDAFTLDSMAGFQAMVANDKDYLATRVSYKLDLRGPSVNLQTACSSGLVVIHEAIKAILAGDCRMALAGTASVKAPEMAGHLYREGMIVSQDGRCRAFDAEASGTIFGSGVGTVLLKPLDEALADGDRVIAVIKGSAVNNDGRRKVGYMAPSQDGETDVTLAAFEAADVSPSTIGLVEAHGTGTLIGDPIEVESLSQAIRQDTDAKQFCALGAVKTNVGHLQISSGMAGFMKAALAVQSGKVPANLHFSRPNPQIDFASSPFFIPTRTMDWPLTEGPRRASVNSLGIGGTNAHLVVEEAPPRTLHPAPAEAELMVLSARDAEDFDRAVARLRDHAATSENLADVAFTLCTGRHQFQTRKALVIDTAASLPEALINLQGVVAEPSPRLVFAFTGQGSQYSGMALGLYRDQPAFRRELDHCANLLADLLDTSLLDLLRGDDATLANTAVTQPVLFAVEYALARFWMACGLIPAALIGHSLGEYVAATLAGVFSVEDALRLVVARGRLMAAQPGDGAMLAVMQGDVDLSAHRELQVAARNSPENTVISGPSDQIAALKAALETAGIDCRHVATSHAFHSQQMSGAAEAFRQAFAWVSLAEPDIPLVSNLTGKFESGLFASPDYWLRHMLEPVDFRGGVQALRAEGLTRVLEIGPHPVLSGFVRTLGGDTVETLRKGRSDLRQILTATARLFEAGHDLNFAPLFEGRNCQRVELPTYPFKKTRYWLQPPAPAERISETPRLHPLVHRAVALPGLEMAVFETDLTDPLPDWVTDHVVQGRPLVAGAAHLAMLVAAASLAGTATPAFSDIRFVGPLFADRPRRVQLRLSGSGAEIVSYALDQDGFSRHVSADMAPDPGADPAIGQAAPDTLAGRVTGDELRHQLAARQIALGPSFSWLRSVEFNADCARYVLAPPDGLHVDTALGLHPGLVDSLLQPALTLLSFGASHETFVPVALQRFALHRLPEAFPLLGTMRRRPEGGQIVDLEVRDAVGRPVLVAEGFELRRLTHGDDLAQALVEVRWLPNESTSHWRKRPSPADYLAGPAIKDDAFQARIAAIAGPRDLQRTEELEELALAYLAEALHGAGAIPAAGQVIDRGKIVASLSLAPEFDKALDRLLQLMVRHGRLLDAGPGLWQGVLLPDALASTEQARRIRAKHGEAVISEVALLEAAGSRLGSILSGKTDPLEALFPGGDLSAATALYRDSAGFSVLNTLVGRLVAQIASAAPPDYVLRVLEIGAGTGATTHHVLPHLAPDRSTYVFTDISNLFLKAARESFADASFMEFRLFDVEKDPGPQGLKADFDLVIASNVLHATVSITETLANARRLLRPGGYLILLEVNEPTVPVDLTFGLLKGWWRFADHDLRPDYPLLSRSQWLTALEAAGFASASAADLEIPTPGGLQTVFVAQMPEGPSSSALRVVGEDEFGLTAALRAFGTGADEPSSDTVLIARDADDAERLRKLATTGPGGKLHVVMDETAGTAALWGLMRVLRHELPDRAGRILSVTADTPADRIATALVDPLLPDELVLTSDGSVSPVLAPLRLALPEPVCFDHEGVHLITGGMGGIGLRLAHGLIAQGARHVALVGRTLRDSAELAKLQAEQDVTVHLADVTDLDAMGRVVRDITARHPLHGVFHLAGILKPALLETEGDLLANMSAKLRGGEVLDRLCAEVPELRHFVLFSSAAAWFGLPGQGAYAAGNSALDGLALKRRRRGFPALSVNWGRWAEVGMVGSARDAAAIRPDDGIALLFRLMATDLGQVGVLPGDWKQEPTQPRTPAPNPAPAAATNGATGAAVDFLKQQIGRLLGGSAALDTGRTLPELGLDSLMCIDLRGRINDDFGIRLSLGTMMETPLMQLSQELDAAKAALAGPAAATEVEFVL